MKKKALIIGAIAIGVLALLAVFFSQNKRQSTAGPSTNNMEANLPASPGFVQTFKGTSPCADCPGIDVVLTLKSEQQGYDYGTFTMQSTYQGKNMSPLVNSGNWTVDRGSAANINDTVVVLIAQNPEYFLRVNKTTMRALDGNKKELPTPYNYTLTLQQPIVE